MAPSLDRIFSGLGSGLSTFAGLQTKANQYKDQQAKDAEERDRQIQRDALSKALSEANISHLNAETNGLLNPAPKKSPFTFMGGGTARGNPDTGVVEPTGYTPPPEPVKPEAPRNIDPLSPSGMAARLKLQKDLDAQKPVAPAKMAKPSIGAENAYGILPVLQQADQELDGLAGTDFSALVSRKAGIMGRFFLTPEQKQYNDAIDDFSLQYVTAVHGKRVSPEVIHGVQNMLRYVPGDDPATTEKKVSRRKQFLKAAAHFAESARAYHEGADNGPSDRSGSTSGGSAAGRWEELVSGGMDKAAATAQVKQEFSQ